MNVTLSEHSDLKFGELQSGDVFVLLNDRNSPLMKIQRVRGYNNHDIVYTCIYLKHGLPKHVPDDEAVIVIDGGFVED